MMTIPAALEAAAGSPERPGFTFLRDGQSDSFVAFHAILAYAAEIAAALIDQGMNRRDRVALALPSPELFVPVLLGIQGAGGVPVPLPVPIGPGQAAAHSERWRQILRSSAAALVITTARLGAEILPQPYGLDHDLRRLTPESLVGHGVQRWEPALAMDELALLQYTSGSVTQPKGVALTYANVAANCHAILYEGLATRPGDRMISWLPLYHDMGLIGPVFCPIFGPHVGTTLIPSATFFRRPWIWLQTLSRLGGTMTYAPTFAYALAARRIQDTALLGVDLSSVRVAGVEAEPIQAETLRMFAQRYASYGFRPSAFVPSYGMAESTLAISFGRGLTTDRVSARALSANGFAEPTVVDRCMLASPHDQPAEDEQVLELVSCGPPFRDHELKIVDPDTHEDLPERMVGEILVRGPSVMHGYFAAPDATRQSLTQGDYLCTGDLGYLVAGELFVCGRKKDVIIVDGRNYYPHDIEWCALQVEGVRLGSVVAFAAARTGLEVGMGGERVAVVAETRRIPDLEGIAERIGSEIQRRLGLLVDEILLVPPRTIPKTPNGKLQRAEARRRYELAAWQVLASRSSSRHSASVSTSASISE